MANWVVIDDTHFNTENLTGFRWDCGKLWLWDSTENPFTFSDKDRALYARLCSACGVNMIKEDNE